MHSCLVKSGNQGFKSYGMKLETLPHQRVNSGIDEQLSSIICLQNDLKWHDLESLDIWPQSKSQSKKIFLHPIYSYQPTMRCEFYDNKRMLSI